MSSNNKVAKMPVARVPGSVPDRLESLTVGESLAEAIRYEVKPDTPKQSQAWIDQTVRVLSVNVNRVKKANPKHNYTVERITHFSQAGALICAVVVTRTA